MKIISLFFAILLFALFLSATVFGQTTNSPDGSSFGGSSGSSMGSNNFPTPPVPTEPLDDRLDCATDANGVLQIYNFSAGANQYLCGDHMDDVTASIICRSMGQQAPGKATIVPDLNPVDGSWVSDLVCQTGAITIINKEGICSWNTAPSCANEHRIQLSCGKVETAFTFSIGDNGLIFATRQSDGIIGQVGNTGMTTQTAQGICSTMNFVPQVQATWWTLSNYEAMPIVVDSIICPSVVTNFATQCNYAVNTQATPLDAVAIDCNSTNPNQPTPSALNVRFSLDSEGLLRAAPVGGVKAFVGIRNTNPGKSLAETICRWMGYTDTSVMVPSSVGVTAGFAFFDSLTCPNMATNLQDCTYTLGTPNTTESDFNAFSVYCGDVKVSYDLQLSPTGLVQLAQPGTGQWTGTMCGDGGATFETIQGICNIANKGVAATYNHVAAWNQGGNSQASILADNVHCNKSMTALSECAFDVNNYCTHDQDLAVICDTTVPNLFQFQVSAEVDGSYAKVQPMGATAFSPICGDSISQSTATAICSFAGLPTGSVTTLSMAQSEGPFGLTYLDCPATATSIFDCRFSQAGTCGSFLQLRCRATTTTTTSTTTTAATTLTSATTTTTSTTTSTTTATPPTNPTTTSTKATSTSAPSTSASPTQTGPTTSTSTSTTTTTTTTTTTMAPTKYPVNTVTFNYPNGKDYKYYSKTDFADTLAMILGISSGNLIFDSQTNTADVITITSANATACYNLVVSWTSLPPALAKYGTNSADNSNAAPNSPSASGGGSDAGPIAGGVIGGIVGLALIGFLVYHFTRPAARTSNDRNSVQFRAGTEYVQHEEV